MIIIQKYLGIYTLFEEKDINDKPLTDIEAKEKNIYLKGKYNTEIYRYDKNTIAIYFPSNQTMNNISDKLEELNIKANLFGEGDRESVYLFKEKDMDKLHQILKFQIKGKNLQLKEFKKLKKKKK